MSAQQLAELVDRLRRTVELSEELFRQREYAAAIGRLQQLAIDTANELEKATR